MKNKTSAIQDNELINMYINGNNESLSVLYTKYWSLFKAVSKKYLCNNHDAEDLVHSVIERLLMMPLDKRVKNFYEVKSVSSFFYTVIKNASLDQLRKKKIKCVSLDFVDVSEDEILENKRLKYKHAGLSSSELFCLEEYLSGKKPQQISQETSRSVSTIKNTLHNAKQKILIYYKKKNHKSV
jgi:RNA polymerase sigma factor (sigma-70 family)